MPSGVSLMLAGFRSRWTMPLLVRRLERLGDLPRDLERLLDRDRARAQPLGQVSPSTSSMARNDARAVHAALEAVDAAMFGWLSEASSFASRSKRARRSASRAKPSGRTLIATSRPSVVSRGPIDLAHPAGAEGGGDAVVAEGWLIRSGFLRTGAQPWASSGTSRLAGPGFYRGSRAARRPACPKARLTVDAIPPLGREPEGG